MRETFLTCDKCKSRDLIQHSQVRQCTVKIEPGISTTAELCPDCRILLCDAIREHMGEAPVR